MKKQNNTKAKKKSARTIMNPMESSQLPGFLLLLIMSTQVQAAEMLAWKSYLFAVVSISVVVGGILSLRNPNADSRLGKLLLAGLYFWVLTFAQLIVLALIYYLNN